MARPLRKCLPDVTYHCHSRCQALQNLFSSDKVKEIAVGVINKAIEKYEFKLIHLEFAENHFHIVIKTTKEGATISSIMQYIKARIAERYNRLTHQKGHFWNDRFKSKIVEEAEDPRDYFLYLLWYIAYNLVRKKIINNPRKSKYGTINVYLDESHIPRVPITMHEYFLDLGETFEERVQAFLRYETIYRDKHGIKIA